MAGYPSEEIPRWLWRAVIGGMLAVLAGTLALLVITLSGLTDPQPVGSPVIDREPELTVSGQGEDSPFIHLLDAPFTPPGSAALTLRQTEGSSAVFTGLALTSESGALLMGYNADGYYVVWKLSDGALTYLVEPHRFPHIQPGDASNHLQVNITSSGLTVRLNQEVASQFAPDVLPGGALRIGAFVQGSPGEAFRVERLQVWESDAPDE